MERSWKVEKSIFRNLHFYVWTASSAKRARTWRHDKLNLSENRKSTFEIYVRTGPKSTTIVTDQVK